MACQGGFPIQTLDFQDYRPDRSMNYLVAGFAVLMVFLLMRPQSPMCPMAVQRASTHLTAMVATAGNVVSARIGEVMDGGNLMPASASLTTTDIPAGSAVVLVDCKGCKTNKDAWQAATDQEKAKCEATARAFLAAHKTVVMLYAPWCPHCHQAMSSFAKAALSAPSGVKFLMINAEALPRTAFQGEGSLYDLQYFPTFAATTGPNGSLQEASDVSAAAASLDSNGAAVAAPASDATPAAPAAAASESDDGAAMLRKLF